jgi:hypothetical protein
VVPLLAMGAISGIAFAIVRWWEVRRAR